jgi:3-phenylpropionate/trans-cinnamate dioxygenase ferredoxin reductase subunit
MDSDQTFVIVGASLAGAKAAETLRTEGFDGRVVLIGEETERPYERPMLSKEYLRGEKPADRLYIHDEGFYADNDIELMTGTRVESLNPGRHEIALTGGRRMRYSRLLLATGAAPRRLPLPGADLPGVAYLRAMGESDALRAAITAASRVIVIGAGWIGSEVAASARQLGAEVAIVAPEAVPLVRVLGPEVGGVYRDLHAGHGVDLHLSTQIEAIVGDGVAGGVRTTEGVVIEGDLVVVGVGVSPRVELAKDAGLTVENGIVVDEFLATSAPDVFAAGDVAATWNTRYNRRIRMEHWANALNQGPAAARNMLGQHTAYEKLPYFYSDQYDLGMEYNGYATDWDRVVLRGDRAGREFLAFWLKDGRVLAGMNANIWDQGDDIKVLIRSAATIDPDRLADPSVPLADLLASPAVKLAGPAVKGGSTLIEGGGS